MEKRKRGSERKVRAGVELRVSVATPAAARESGENEGRRKNTALSAHLEDEAAHLHFCHEPVAVLRCRGLVIRARVDADYVRGAIRLVFHLPQRRHVSLKEDVGCRAALVAGFLGAQAHRARRARRARQCCDDDGRERGPAHFLRKRASKRSARWR